MCVLDCVCVEDPSMVFRTFPSIKALFSRLSSDLSYARVLLPIAQFYLNHGNHFSYNLDFKLSFSINMDRFYLQIVALEKV